MGHGVHDAVSEHDPKFSPNSDLELVDGKKDEQLVRSCKLWLSTGRQVSMMYLVVPAGGSSEEGMLVLPMAYPNLVVT